MLKKHVDDDEIINWSLWRFQVTFRVKPPDMLSVQFWDNSLLLQALTVVVVVFREHSLVRPIPWILFLVAVDLIQLHRMKKRFKASFVDMPIEDDKWAVLESRTQLLRYSWAFWALAAVGYMTLLGKIIS